MSAKNIDDNGGGDCFILISMSLVVLILSLKKSPNVTSWREHRTLVCLLRHSMKLLGLIMSFKNRNLSLCFKYVFI